MSYHKYHHIERLEHPAVDGLLIGECYIFPKLDGTNAVLWMEWETGVLCTGSRKRDLTEMEGEDNAGFKAEMVARADRGELRWMESVLFRDVTFHGEWLVPHTLKTYREEAWREFYIFDAYDRVAETHIPYRDWAPLLISQGVKVIEPLQIITNPTLEDVVHVRDTHNTYLIEENSGVGEGVVVKNYAFKNRFGHQIWGKSVRNDFKEEAARAFGTAERDGSFQVELAIAEEFVTRAFVDKTRAKIEQAIIEDAKRNDDFEIDLDPRGTKINGIPGAQWLAAQRGQLIPRLLQSVFYELLTEETWAFVKKHKNPTIDFKKLQSFVTAQTKAHAWDLF